jgi:hypothetical protein
MFSILSFTYIILRSNFLYVSSKFTIITFNFFVRIHIPHIKSIKIGVVSTNATIELKQPKSSQILVIFVRKCLNTLRNELGAKGKKSSKVDEPNVETFNFVEPSNHWT